MKELINPIKKKLIDKLIKLKFQKIVLINI